MVKSVVFLLLGSLYSFQYNKLTSCFNYIKQQHQTNLEKRVEFPHKEVFCTSQVVSCGNAQGQVWVLEDIGDVSDDVLLIHTDTQHLKQRQQCLTKL